MGKVITLVDKGFEDMEAMYPYYRFKEEGYDVQFVAYSPGIYNGKNGYPIMVNTTPFDIDMGDVNAVIIPGGYAPDHMRTKPEMVEMVRMAVELDIVIGAICHGPQMLIEADVIEGRKVTCYRSIKKDIINAGAEYINKAVVTDRNIVTSRTPDDLPDFCKTILKRAKRS